MQKLLNFIKKNKFYIISFLTFFLIRRYVLANPPQDYSDVSHFYERYANIWWYGLPPYLKHLFEYGPFAALLIIVPLAIDLAGLGYYYLNYRVQTFLLETIVFFFILKALQKIFKKSSQKYFSAFFYCLAPLIAKDFWYEGVDIAFYGSLTLAIVFALLLDQKKLKNKIVFWAFFWLSVATKLITAPLFVPFFFIKSKLKKESLLEELKGFVLGFLIIWAIPLAIFRTSLSVALFFHGKRPLHASSFPAFIIYTINHFTKSETMYKLEWFGTLSSKALRWSFVALAVSILLVYVWVLWKKLAKPKTNHYLFLLQTSLFYTILFIFSSKIFSPPFNIWYTLLLTIFPYKNKRTQLLFFFLGIWGLVFNTTNIVKLPETIMIYPFTWHYLRHLFKFPALLAMMLLGLKQPEVNFKKSR